MASGPGHYKRKELSITDIEEGETKQIASGTYFVNIQFNGEIKEEATELKQSSEYGVSNECLGNNEKFYDTNSSESGVEDPKCSSNHFWENASFSGLAGELAKPKVNHFNTGVILKNEDENHPEYTNDLWTNNAGSKTETLKTEDDIDIIYEDVKPAIYEAKPYILIGTKIEPNCSCGLSIDFCKNKTFNGLGDELAKPEINHFDNGVILKNEDENHLESINDLWTNNAESKTETLKTEDGIDIVYGEVKPEIFEEKPDLLIGPEIEANFSREPSIDSWPKQNIEDAITVESDNDTRQEPTVTNSRNCQMIQKLPHCKNSKFYPFEPKQEFNERPHTGEEPFQCKSCSHSFDVKQNLLQHEKIHRNKKPFQCQICLKNFAIKSLLLKHERIHTGEKPYLCKICNKSFNQKANLTKHERIHTEKKTFRCKICPKSFKQKQVLTRHEIIHTGEKPFQCKICSKCFAYKYTLLYHERIHTGERPYQCQICSKSFAKKESLTKHGRIHTGEKPFQCKICSKAFKENAGLTRHGRIHTGKKPFQCKICPKNFSQKHTLLEHVRIHTGEKPLQCKVCSKCFAYKITLFYHERIHTGEKPHQCKICSKSFVKKNTLTKHEKIHSGEKPFQCKICPKSFTENAELTRHEKIHSEEKLFQCKICPKSFKQKSYLTKHQRIHTGEKSLQCKICEASFNQKAKLTVHERIHTGE